MSKEFTQVLMDKPRLMRFGYKVIKQLDSESKKGIVRSELEALEYMIYLSLVEDDPTLKVEDIENLLNESDMEHIKDKLDETIRRDMPGLASKAAELGNLQPELTATPDQEV